MACVSANIKKLQTVTHAIARGRYVSPPSHHPFSNSSPTHTSIKPLSSIAKCPRLKDPGLNTHNRNLQKKKGREAKRINHLQIFALNDQFDGREGSVPGHAHDQRPAAFAPRHSRAVTTDNVPEAAGEEGGSARRQARGPGPRRRQDGRAEAGDTRRRCRRRRRGVAAQGRVHGRREEGGHVGSSRERITAGTWSGLAAQGCLRKRSESERKSWVRAGSGGGGGGGDS